MATFMQRHGMKVAMLQSGEGASWRCSPPGRSRWWRTSAGRGSPPPGSGAPGQPTAAALRLANRLVANAEDAAGIEVVFGGLAVRAYGLLTVGAGRGTGTRGRRRNAGRDTTR